MHLGYQMEAALHGHGLVVAKNGVDSCGGTSSVVG